MIVLRNKHSSGTTISTYDMGETLITINNAVQVGGIATTTQLKLLQTLIRTLIVVFTIQVQV